jgi:hypothetical protein
MRENFNGLKFENDFTEAGLYLANGNFELLAMTYLANK